MKMISWLSLSIHLICLWKFLKQVIDMLTDMNLSWSLYSFGVLHEYKINNIEVLMLIIIIGQKNFLIIVQCMEELGVRSYDKKKGVKCNDLW